MSNPPPESPFQARPPEAKRLVKSVLVAAALAALVLVTIVLPAEYAIDPTGVGRVLGLTQMRAGAAQPIRIEDTLGGNENIATAQVPDVGEPLPLPNRAVFQQESTPARSQTLTISLPVGGETEVKAVLQANKVIVYSWQTDGDPVYVDFHGHSPDWPDKKAFVRYLEAQDGTTTDSGSLVAPFAGEHGWYWLNITDHPITITLAVSGYYDEIKDYGLF